MFLATLACQNISFYYVSFDVIPSDIYLSKKLLFNVGLNDAAATTVSIPTDAVTILAGHLIQFFLCFFKSKVK